MGNLKLFIFLIFFASSFCSFLVLVLLGNEDSISLKAIEVSSSPLLFKLGFGLNFTVLDEMKDSPLLILGVFDFGGVSILCNSSLLTSVFCGLFESIEKMKKTWKSV